MRFLLAVLPCTMLTVLCWGVYGPVLHHGKHAMGDSSLRQLMCVGISYFFIAVLVPLLILQTRGEQGKWTMTGAIWSLMAGVCGALGALGIILSLNSGGNPVYVMPLVFGGAPVINTFVSMSMSRLWGNAGKVFYIGVILVALGAAGVMYFKPGAKSENLFDLSIKELVLIFGSIGLTVICWGTYGSVLHKGQAKMQGSRLRPLLCVGLAYFAIAVIVPSGALAATPVEAPWTWTGAIWSLAGGAAGAIGALGIILSFTFGGKPVYVMPLVFGGAPVINTLVTVIEKQNFLELPITFYASLAVVIAGAVTVLVFAPKPTPPGKKNKKNKSIKKTHKVKETTSE